MIYQYQPNINFQVALANLMSKPRAKNMIIIQDLVMFVLFCFPIPSPPREVDLCIT